MISPLARQYFQSENTVTSSGMNGVNISFIALHRNKSYIHG